MNILKSLKEQLHTFKMTDTERADIRVRLSHHMHQYQPKNSFFMISPYMNGVWQKRLAISAAAFLVVMITSGSGLAYASSASLPGDKLYTVKVTTEEMQAVVKTSPEARATFEVKRAERRIGEAVTLASQGKLDDSKKRTISANLKRHTQKVAIETSKLAQENPEGALEVSARLALSLEAHNDIIANTIASDGLAMISQQVTEAQAEAEVEKASATEILVASGNNAITKDQLDEKKARLAVALAALPQQEVVADETTAEVAVLDTTEPAAVMMTTSTPAADMRIMTKSAVAITPEAEIALLIATSDELALAGNYTEAFLKLQAAEEIMIKLQFKNAAETKEQEPITTEPELISETPATATQETIPTKESETLIDISTSPEAKSNTLKNADR